MEPCLLKKIAIMPSQSELYAELFKYDAHISLKNESTYEGAMFALKTIESEVEAANFLAYHNPDYSTLKKEYEELRSDILKIENMHLKAFYFN